MQEAKSKSRSANGKASSPSLVVRLSDWLRGQKDKGKAKGGRTKAKGRLVGQPIVEDDMAFPEPDEHAAHPGHNVMQRWASQ